MSLMSRLPQGGPFFFGCGAPPPVPAPDVQADPTAVSRQKEEYARALEGQLKEGADQLGTTMKQQVDALHAQAAQEKSLHSLLVDQQVKQQELLLSQQYNQQLMLLTQAAQRQGAELEQQATNLMLDYQQRKVEEDFVASQAGVEKQFAEMQQKFVSELAKSNVFPNHAIQPPVLGAGMPPLGQLPNLSPSLAPPMLPGQAPPMPYMPPALPGGLRVPGVSARPSGSSFGQPGASARAPLPGSFSSQGRAIMPPVAAPQLSWVPGQTTMAAGVAAMPRPGVAYMPGTQTQRR